MEDKEKEKPQPGEQSSEKDLALTRQESKSIEIEKTQSEAESPAPEQVMEVLREMPPDIRKSFMGFAASFSQISRPRYNPLFDKFTSEHIHKYLDYVQRDDDHDFELKKTNRWFYLGYVIIALGVFVVGVIYLIPRDRDLLIQLIVILVAIAGGIGGGYGLSKRRPE